MAHRVLVVLLLVGAAARAQSAFGSQKQFVPFGTVSYSHFSAGGNSADGLMLAPGVMYFPTTSLAIGLQPTYGYTSVSGLGGASAHILGLEPLVGFGVPVAEHLAFFPRVGIDFSWVFPSPGNSTNQITMRGFAPVLYIPAPHFYVGFGPTFSVDLDSSFAKETSFGLASEIGGYF
jgi:hypothetical protein